MNEKNIHVLYYVPGKNMMGLQRLMVNLRHLWGNNIVALPKDFVKLAQNEMSVNDLIGIRNMLNGIIVARQRELGIIPKPPVNTQQNPQQSRGNMMPGGGYQPQNGPGRPPAPPTSGSNAVKPAPRVTTKGFIKAPFEAPPIPTKTSETS